MFNKSKLQKNVNQTDTLIGEGTVVKGKITTGASLRIDGSVIGEIECSGDVTIGERGVIQSSVTARNIYNAGSIQGNVHAKGKLSVTSKGRINGNVRVAALHVSEGGILNGECVMETAPAKDKETSGPSSGSGSGSGKKSDIVQANAAS